MFNFFKSKTELEKLQSRYAQLMNEAHRLSTINRADSDKKVAEAEEVLKKIDALKA